MDIKGPLHLSSGRNTHKFTIVKQVRGSELLISNSTGYKIPSETSLFLLKSRKLHEISHTSQLGKRTNMRKIDELMRLLWCKSKAVCMDVLLDL